MSDGKAMRTTTAKISGPEPVELAGRRGLQYWVHDSTPLTGNAEVDEALSGFPVVVFLPHGRNPADTPIVLAAQGMGAPWQWNEFAVRVLLDLGIACVLVETPLAGDRGLARKYNGQFLDELAPLGGKGIVFGADALAKMMDFMCRDYRTALDIAVSRHGLHLSKHAVFGVSLGAIYGSYAFMRDGIGERLLCAIGMPDLFWFAKSFNHPLLWTAGIIGQVLGPVVRPVLPGSAAIALDFCKTLNTLAYGGDESKAANPMTYCDRVGNRRVRLLLGEKDPLLRPADGEACAKRFKDGQAYVVPGMAHGGDGFVDHARFFLWSQMKDWGWP